MTIKCHAIVVNVPSPRLYSRFDKHHAGKRLRRGSALSEFFSLSVQELDTSTWQRDIGNPSLLDVSQDSDMPKRTLPETALNALHTAGPLDLSVSGDEPEVKCIGICIKSAENATTCAGDQSSVPMASEAEAMRLLLLPEPPKPSHLVPEHMIESQRKCETQDTNPTEEELERTGPQAIREGYNLKRTESPIDNCVRVGLESPKEGRNEVIDEMVPTREVTVDGIQIHQRQCRSRSRWPTPRKSHSTEAKSGNTNRIQPMRSTSRFSSPSHTVASTVLGNLRSEIVQHEVDGESMRIFMSVVERSPVWQDIYYYATTAPHLIQIRGSDTSSL